ncbi:MAG: (2Fe-2S) ferredoxin domain-containing protein [Spirochaetales bacterium]|nr:(2Fe-2S) ferredoxin domain-containing protein [Spirochaetales bacterium]
MNGQTNNKELPSAIKTITVCVGSSCHIKGARDVIGQFNDLLKKNKLTEKIELKGSFCMERCGKGINWQIDETPVTSTTPEEAVDFFIQEIINPLQEH